MAGRSAWLVWTGVALGAVVLAYLFVDRPVATLAHDVWHRPALGVALTHIADVPLPLAGAALVAAGLQWLAGGRPDAGAARAVLATAIAILVARAFADELKFVFGRPWPETWVDANPSWIGTHVFGFFPLHGGRGYASFPSGHTIDIAAPCAALWRFVPRLRLLAVALVLAVAGGLVASDYHFVSDVLAGAYVGIVIGYGVTALIAA